MCLFLYKPIWRRRMRPYYITGPGNIAPAHIDALELRDRKLQGVSSRQPRIRFGDLTDLKCNMGPVGKKVHLATAFEHQTQLCQEMDHNGIVICTLPTNLHHSMGVTAASHNRHCLMEKPFCSSSEAAADLISAYETSTGKLGVNHILPFFPAYDYLAAELQKWGKQTTKVRLTRCTARTETQNSTWVKAVGGNAPDLFAHDGHLAILAFGMPTKVTVHKVEFMHGVPVYMEVTLGYPTTEVEISCGSPPESTAFNSSFYAVRSNGDVIRTTANGVECNQEEVLILEKSIPEVFASAHDLFEQYVDGKRDNLGPLCPNLALQTVELIEHCVAACATPGKTINL